METQAAMLGMSEHEFYHTTPRWFFRRQKGWQRNIEREENWHHWHLELQRTSLTYLLNIQIDRNDRKKREDLFPLPWDDEQQVTASKEDLKKWAEKQGLLEIPIEKF